MARIIIADDHPIFRRGLRDIIEELDGGHRIVAEAADGAAALRQVAMLQPDILVTDLAMPRMDGLALLERLSEIAPGVAVVILSMHADPAYLDRAFALGAQGYVLKDDAADDLGRCLTALEAGEIYISPRIGHQGPQAPGLEPDQEARLRALSPVHLEVLRHLAEHRTSKEIAENLGLSHRTVQNHRAAIAETLGLGGRNALLAFAVRHRHLLGDA